MRTRFWRARHDEQLRPQISGRRLSAARPADAPVILGIGVDLVEVAMFEGQAARSGTGFLEGMFHPAEIAYCRGMRDPWPYFAARFAAKQALFKALGTLRDESISWRDVEVVRGEEGRPSLVLHGETARLAAERSLGRVHLSLTHEESCVAALVVIEAG